MFYAVGYACRSKILCNLLLLFDKWKWFFFWRHLLVVFFIFFLLLQTLTKLNVYLQVYFSTQLHFFPILHLLLFYLYLAFTSGLLLSMCVCVCSIYMWTYEYAVCSICQEGVNTTCNHDKTGKRKIYFFRHLKQNVFRFSFLSTI